jgi:hypothetical protein
VHAAQDQVDDQAGSDGNQHVVATNLPSMPLLWPALEAL